MCDYSLHHVASRPAKVSDKLVTTELARSSARGFAAIGELGAKLVIHDSPPQVAVCLLPGTELAFDDDVRYDRAFSLFGKARVRYKVARFREIDGNDPHVLICDLGWDKDFAGLHLIRELRKTYPDIFVIGTSMGEYSNRDIDTRQPSFHMFLDK